MITRIDPSGMKALGAYSQAIRVDLGAAAMILVSGQLPLGPDGKAVAPDDIEAQTRHVFANLQTVLAAAGAGLADIVKVQIYLLDVANFSRVSAVRNEFFAAIRPASTLIEISRTVIDGCHIEIDAIAMVKSASGATT